MQPQDTALDLKVQPRLNPSLSSSEEISNNQTLPAEAPEAGAEQPTPLHAPTWTDIQTDPI